MPRFFEPYRRPIRRNRNGRHLNRLSKWGKFIRQEHEASLEGLWGLQEYTPLSDAKDLSLNGRAGTYINGADLRYVDGPGLRGIHAAARFNGSDQYVEIGSDSVFNFGSGEPFTIFCWFKYFQRPKNQTIFGKWEGGAGYFLYFRQDDGEPILYVEDQSGSSDFLTSDRLFSDGEEGFLVWSRFSDLSHKCWVNDELVFTGSSGVDDLSNTKSTEIGRRPDGATYLESPIAYMGVLSKPFEQQDVDEAFVRARRLSDLP